MVRFRYKPRGDWFSFAKVENLVSFAPVNKLVRLAYLWGTCAAHTSYVIRWNGFRIWQLDEVREKCLLSLKYGYFSYNFFSHSLQEAFIHPPEPCKAHLLWMHALYLMSFGLWNKNTHHTCQPSRFSLGFSVFYHSIQPFKYFPVFFIFLLKKNPTGRFLYVYICIQ